MNFSPNRAQHALVASTLVLLLGREVCAGAVRYYLARAHVSMLWFLPDALLLAALGLRLVLWVRGTPLPKPLLYVLCGCALASTTGIMAFGHVAAVGAGIKLLFPLFAVMMVPPTFLNARAWLRACYLLLGLGITGVAADLVTDMPWSGFTLSQFGLERAASRKWWVHGMERPAGLGASSSSTAGCLLLLTLIVARHLHKPGHKLGLYLVALWAVRATTSSTTFGALLVAVAVDLWPYRTLRGFGPGRRALLVAFCASFLLPTLIGVGAVVANHYGIDVPGMSSLRMRALLTWPGVVDMAVDEGWLSAVVGHGFGSIGGPAKYTGTYVSPISAVDNLFLYMLYLFGLFAVVLAAGLLRALMSMPRQDRPLAFALCAITATLSSDGVSSLLLVGIVTMLGYFPGELDRRQVHGKRFVLSWGGPAPARHVYTPQ